MVAKNPLWTPRNGSATLPPRAGSPEGWARQTAIKSSDKKQYEAKERVVNKLLRWLAVGVVAVVCAAPAAQAEGWSLSKLNPFAKSTSSSKKKKSTAKPSFKLPKWKTPAPIQKVNQSTTRMAAKTWDTLTFWDNGKKSKNSWGGGAKPYKRKQVEKESWLDNLFTAKEEKPKTPNEFLSGKRPEDYSNWGE
jgi:hypothetical protein